MERDDGAKLVVRSLENRDVERVVGLDAHIVGRRRDGYLRPKIQEALAQTGVRVSLVAEAEGQVVGFLLAKVWYGEFGELDPVAVLDTLGVDTSARGHGAASSMLDQLRMNLGALGIRRLRTEVAWDNQTLLSYFAHEGFVPAARFVLETDPGSPAARERRERRLERAMQEERPGDGR